MFQAPERKPAPLPDESAVRDALREVIDPEAGMDIVELGLVYGIVVTPECVTIDMTMTTPACPVADMLVDQAHNAAQRVVPDGVEIQVNLVWEPVWNPSMMSGVAKDFFGWQPG